MPSTLPVSDFCQYVTMWMTMSLHQCMALMLQCRKASQPDQRAHSLPGMVGVHYACHKPLLRYRLSKPQLACCVQAIGGFIGAYCLYQKVVRDLSDDTVIPRLVAVAGKPLCVLLFHMLTEL